MLARQVCRPRSDVEPMDKTYIGPQADDDVGPISLPPAVGVLAGRVAPNRELTRTCALFDSYSISTS